MPCDIALGPISVHKQLLQTAGMDSNGLTTIKGLIIPVDWDDRGNIIAAAVSTYFEEEYLIDQNPWGEELLAFVRQRVKASGIVRDGNHGKKILTVKRYEILEE